MLNDHAKTIFIATIFVGFSMFFHFLSKKEGEEENNSHVVTFSFVQFLDKIWIRDLYANMKKGAHAWDDGSFTKEVAHCDVNCNKNGRNETFHYDSQCETFPILIYDSQITSKLVEIVSLAEATLPCILHLMDSTIPNANKGVFSRYKVSKGFVFGPYRGITRYDVDVNADPGLNDYSYTWAVNYTDKNGIPGIFEVDGIDANSSNWMRWVNSARYEEEQNMISMIFNQSVYYMTYKDVEPNTELLVWYGKAFADQLDIKIKASSNYYWYTDFAPPIDDVICPTCPVSVEPEDEDEVDDDEDEKEDEESETNHNEH